MGVWQEKVPRQRLDIGAPEFCSHSLHPLEDMIPFVSPPLIREKITQSFPLKIGTLYMEEV